MAELTPMMLQYLQIKKENNDSILLFRLGDFYEMFFEDAILASKELDIVLTGRECGNGKENKAPMCGVPFHSVDNYISRLLAKGYKVSICEQIKNPETNEVIDRNVVRTITPGTIIDPSMLDEKVNNYIVCIYSESNKSALCFCDVSTGDIFIDNVVYDNDKNIINELGKYSPKEVYINTIRTKNSILFSYFNKNNIVISEYNISNNHEETIIKHFGKTIEQLKINNYLSVKALGELLNYLFITQKASLTHINKLQITDKEKFLEIDSITWRNLEIVETIRNKDKKNSLLGILDKTKTPMGARLLRKYLEKPLYDVSMIIKRQNAVSEFVSKNIERSHICELINDMGDIERISAKVIFDTINPKDMKKLAFSLTSLPIIKDSLKSFSSVLISETYDDFDELKDIHELIEKTIVENPPITIRDGNFIKTGYNSEFDEIKFLLSDTKQIISNIEQREKEKTGIKNLKIGFNKVFGYYIEISNSNLNNIPNEYIRKQTLTNGERFFTQELKDIEEKLLEASEKSIKLENKIYNDIKNYITDNMKRIKKTAEMISQLDVFTNFAEISLKNNYICPIIDLNDVIEIKNGRHPIVEQIITDEIFVPNDTYLNCTNDKMLLITGPNMAGKSTYMRQIALIVLMAQIGCFVPATSAHIGLVDKIFTRIGASDDLTAGQSTFMVEMTEVANILENATKKSLLIFDEIGRGTSTFDGMSIAQAVLEHVTLKISAKSLFATHYHELTGLFNNTNGIKNYNIIVKKRGNDITFLRKIVPGAADDSYGIDVARLAGINPNIIKRAEEILKTIENNEINNTIKNKNKSESDQISLNSSEIDDIMNELKNLDISVLTPVEALNKLYVLIKKSQNI